MVLVDSEELRDKRADDETVTDPVLVVEAVPDTVVVAVVVARVDREDDAVDDDEKLLLRFEPVGDEVAEPVVDMLHDAV